MSRASRKRRQPPITPCLKLSMHYCKAASRNTIKQRSRQMSMKYVDEYRDPEIAKLSGDQPLKLMEVCGGHTHTIYKHGIEDVLPPNIDLVHGPGCPVCVLPMGRIDDAIAIARMENVIFTTFGDMMRVPGSNGSLLDAKAEGADVRFVYSPLD